MTDEQFIIIHDWLTAKINQRKAWIQNAMLSACDEDDISEWKWQIAEFGVCLKWLFKDIEKTEDAAEARERQKLAVWIEKVKL